MRRSSRIRKNSDSGSEIGLSDAEEQKVLTRRSSRIRKNSDSGSEIGLSDAEEQKVLTRRSSRIRKNSDSGSEIGLSDVEERHHGIDADVTATPIITPMRGRRKQKVDVIELSSTDDDKSSSKRLPKKKQEECSTEDDDVLLSTLKEKKATPRSSRKNLKPKILPTVEEDQMLDTTAPMATPDKTAARNTSNCSLRLKKEESGLEVEKIASPSGLEGEKIASPSGLEGEKIASPSGSRGRGRPRKKRFDEIVVKKLASEGIKKRCKTLYTKPDLPIPIVVEEAKKEENCRAPYTTKRKGVNRRKHNGSAVQLVDAGEILLKYAEGMEDNNGDRKDVSDEFTEVKEWKNDTSYSSELTESAQNREYKVGRAGPTEIDQADKVVGIGDVISENVCDDVADESRDQHAQPEVMTGDQIGSKGEKVEAEWKLQKSLGAEENVEEAASLTEETQSIEVKEENITQENFIGKAEKIDKEEDVNIEAGVIIEECKEKVAGEKSTREGEEVEEIEESMEKVVKSVAIEQSKNEKNDTDLKEAKEVNESEADSKEAKNVSVNNQKEAVTGESLEDASEVFESINEKDCNKVKLGGCSQEIDAAADSSENFKLVEKEEVEPTKLNEESEEAIEFQEAKKDGADDSDSSDSHESDAGDSDEDTFKEGENSSTSDQNLSLNQIPQHPMQQQVEKTTSSKPEKRKLCVDRSKYESGLLSNPLLKSVCQLKNNSLFQDLMKKKRTNTQENNACDILSLDGVTMSSEMPGPTSNKKFKLSSSIQTTLKSDMFVDSKTGKCKEGNVDSNVGELMKKSVLKDDLEAKERAPKLFTSKHLSKLQAKKAADETAGKGWYNLPRTELTDKVKHDLQLIKMRNTLDLKHHYKRGESKKLPKYFQMGTIVEGASEFYSARVPKKARKNTMVEELLADAEFRRKNKEKYVELRKKQMDGGKGHYRKKKNRGKKAWERT